jgi:hypothetical protein
MAYEGKSRWRKGVQRAPHSPYHAGVEHDLAAPRTAVTERVSVENGPVLEYKRCLDADVSIIDGRPKMMPVDDSGMVCARHKRCTHQLRRSKELRRTGAHVISCSLRGRANHKNAGGDEGQGPSSQHDARTTAAPTPAWSLGLTGHWSCAVSTSGPWVYTNHRLYGVHVYPQSASPCLLYGAANTTGRILLSPFQPTAELSAVHRLGEE